MTEAVDLPGLLGEMAAACGAKAAMRLADAYGGTKIYVPAEIDGGHEIVKAIGPVAARWLSGAYGSSRIEVPLGPMTTVARQKAAILRLLAAHRSEREIALELRCHIRTVRRYRAAVPDVRQLDLLRRA